MEQDIKTRYKNTYLKNLLKYFFLFNKKVKIRHLEIWVGTRCTSRCKHCNHLIPYIKQELYDIDKVISDLKTLLKYAQIQYIAVMGGDPMCHPKVDKLINFIENEPSLKKGKLVTNGRIIPKEPVMSAIKNSKKIELHIDTYPQFADEVEKFKQTMDKEEIKYIDANNFKTVSQWQFSGDVNQTEIPLDEIIYNYEYCSIKSCTTMSEGEVVMCPRGIVSERIFNLPKNKFENVNIRKKLPQFIKKALLECCLSKKEYKEYCKFCLGLDFTKTKKNIQYIQCGEQLTAEEFAAIQRR